MDGWFSSSNSLKKYERFEPEEALKGAKAVWEKWMRKPEALAVAQSSDFGLFTPTERLNTSRSREYDHVPLFKISTKCFAF
jgi:hypothetical protein